MADFFPEIDISEAQAEAIARGLFAVAHADGKLHEREDALIGDLLSDTHSAAQLAALARSPAIDPASLALALPSRELRHLFVKTALLLAWADGAYGAGEKKLVESFASALEVKDTATIEQQVKDYMIGQLSHVRNTDAVVQVAKAIKA